MLPCIVDGGVGPLSLYRWCIEIPEFTEAAFNSMASKATVSKFLPPSGNISNGSAHLALLF